MIIRSSDKKIRFIEGSVDDGGDATFVVTTLSLMTLGVFK
jgi:hypothetical protein